MAKATGQSFETEWQVMMSPVRIVVGNQSQMQRAGRNSACQPVIRHNASSVAKIVIASENRHCEGQ